MTQSKPLDRTFKKSGVCRFRNKNSLTTSYIQSLICLFARSIWLKLRDLAIIVVVVSAVIVAAAVDVVGLRYTYRTHTLGIMENQ